MYAVNAQSEDWPPLDLDAYLAFLTKRLRLKTGEVVTLVLAENDLSQQLNKTYRGKDRPTNVLSFYTGTREELGDLIFAREVVVAEAAAQKKTLRAHMQHLILHGSLHLLGHDHEETPEAEAMESLEIDILNAYGLPNPYDMLTGFPDD